MRRFAVILVVVLAGVAAGAGVGQGAAPVQLKGIAFSDSFTITGLCAFDVTVTVSGNASVTLWLNKAGKVVREHDTTPGATFTYSGNGNSFSFPSAVSIWTDYGGGGATLGGSATLKLSGMFGHAPGVISSDAGQQVIVGATVIDFDTANGGIPITNGGTIEAEHGHFNSGEAIDAAICAALS
jgi:hypothetical protein